MCYRIDGPFGVCCFPPNYSDNRRIPFVIWRVNGICVTRSFCEGSWIHFFFPVSMKRYDRLWAIMRWDKITWKVRLSKWILGEFWNNNNNIFYLFIHYFFAYNRVRVIIKAIVGWCLRFIDSKMFSRSNTIVNYYKVFKINYWPNIVRFNGGVKPHLGGIMKWEINNNNNNNSGRGHRADRVTVPQQRHTAIVTIVHVNHLLNRRSSSRRTN